MELTGTLTNAINLYSLPIIVLLAILTLWYVSQVLRPAGDMEDTK